MIEWYLMENYDNYIFSPQTFEIRNRWTGKTKKGTKYQKKRNGENYYKMDLYKDNKRTIICKHRFIGEVSNGRNLEKGEDVHHIDENTDNNAPENLEVIRHDEHAFNHGKSERYIQNMKRAQKLRGERGDAHETTL